MRDFSKHRWPKRLRDYCQVLVNEFDEEGVYAKHYELQEEKLAWEEEKRKEEEEELELEKDDDGGGNQTEKEKETKRGDFTPVGQEEKEAKNVRFREKTVLPIRTARNALSIPSLKRKRFYNSPRTKKNKGLRETQNLGWSEREGDIGGIRYEPTTVNTAKKKKKTKKKEEL